MDISVRHQWGPAPSGQPEHRAACRRCGLEEISTWRRLPGGEVTEVVAWVAPTGEVLATRPVNSRQVPRGAEPLPLLEEDTASAPSTTEVLTHCPGTPRAWEPERMGP